MPSVVPAPTRRRILSVRTRIVGWMVLVSAVGLAASGVVSYIVQRDDVLSAIDDKLLRTVDDVQNIASGATFGESPRWGPGDGDAREIAPTSVEHVLETAMRQLVPATNASVLGFVDGTPARAPSTTQPFRIADNTELVRRLLTEARPQTIVFGTSHTVGTIATDAGTTFPATVRYIIIPVHVPGDSRTGLYAVGFDVDAELAAVTHSLDTYARVALGALVLVGLVAWLVAGRLLRPIRLLRDAAVSSSSAVDRIERIPVTGRDDVSNLTEAINDMFDRLRESSLNQQRLLDDVGHELKTPITIIRGQLEILDASQQAEVEATRALAIEELDRMGSLIASISLLAHSRAPHFIERAALPLSDFTAAVGAKARSLDPDRQWIVTAEADAPPCAETTVEIDAERITQAWLQLAANAARHSVPGGTITLTSHVTRTRPTVFTHAVSTDAGHAGTASRFGSPRSRGSDGDVAGKTRAPDSSSDPAERWLCLAVRDVGPGIALSAQSRIFDRFGRVHNTRGAEGSGLGLSIVAAIAHAHGGTVLLDSAAGSGSTFTILIPAGRSAATRPPPHGPDLLFPTPPRPSEDPLDLATTCTAAGRTP